MRSAFNGSFFNSNTGPINLLSTNTNTNNNNNQLNILNNNPANTSCKQLFNANTQLLFNHSSNKLTEPLSAAVLKDNHNNNTPSNSSNSFTLHKNDFFSTIRHSESHPHLAGASHIYHNAVNPPANATNNQQPHQQHNNQLHPAPINPTAKCIAHSNIISSGGSSPYSITNSTPSTATSNPLSSGSLSSAAAAQNITNRAPCSITSPAIPTARAKLGEVVNCLVNKWSSEFLEQAKQGDLECMCIVQKYSKCKGYGCIKENCEEANNWLEKIKEQGKLNELNQYYLDDNDNGNNGGHNSTGDSSGSISSIQSGYLSSDRATTPLPFQPLSTGNNPNSAGNSMKMLPSISIVNSGSGSASAGSSVPNTPIAINDDKQNIYSQTIGSGSAASVKDTSANNPSTSSTSVPHDTAQLSHPTATRTNSASVSSIPHTHPHLLEHGIAINGNSTNTNSSRELLSSTPSPSRAKMLQQHQQQKNNNINPPANNSTPANINPPLVSVASPTDSPNLSFVNSTNTPTPLSSSQDSNSARRFSITI